MKQKQLGLWAPAVLLATAASPTFAGTWDTNPAPASVGYTPTYGAASVGAATKTATVQNNNFEPVYGQPIDTDGRTHVRFNWNTADPRTDPAPASASASFLWTYSGDVSQVSETVGEASARLQMFPYNRQYVRRILRRSYGAVMEDEPAAQNPQPQSLAASAVVVNVFGGTSYVEVDFAQGVSTDAMAYYYGNSYVQAAASATSAAATIGVVHQSVQTTP